VESQNKSSPIQNMCKRLKIHENWKKLSFCLMDRQWFLLIFENEKIYCIENNPGLQIKSPKQANVTFIRISKKLLWNCIYQILCFVPLLLEWAFRLSWLFCWFQASSVELSMTFNFIVTPHEPKRWQACLGENNVEARSLIVCAFIIIIIANCIDAYIFRNVSLLLR